MEEYDVIIVGAGAAGMTAGIYCARNGLKTAILSKDIGGTANSILLLENYPGFYGSGAELMKKFYDLTKKYEIDFIMDEVDLIKKQKEKFLIKTKGPERVLASSEENVRQKKNLISKSVIIATGTERKKLKIPGEEKFIGKGVSYCVTCDAFFFKNKTVAVIGGSDCAATSAVALTKLAKKVFIIYRGEKLRCEEINAERLKKSENVEIIYKAIPIEIKGNEKVESLIIKKNEKVEEIKVDGIFVEIGAVPFVKFAKHLNLKLDKENYIIVNEKTETSVKGIFAAGDITNSNVKQVVTAAGQGAIAGKSVYDFLNKT